MNSPIPAMARRLRVGSMALALALAGCIDGGSSSSSERGDFGSAPPPTFLPVTIKNRSGQTVYVNFTGDQTKPFSVSPTTATIAEGASATFDVTQVSAGRIYLSYGTALHSNAPDGANTADPDYHTRFDKLELTYNQGAGGKANLTAVDFYAIPLLLETSIQGTVIEHLTLAPGQTGTTLQNAIANLIGATNLDKAQVKTTSGSVARILSPVKRPAAYGNFDAFLETLAPNPPPPSPPPTWTVDIAGTYFGIPSQDYHYTGSIDENGITLSDPVHTIVVSHESLAFDATNTVDHDGIYTCNAPFTVDGAAHTVADNDVYAAVYRDLVTAFNLGFITTGANTSSAWWGSPAFPSNAFAGTYYNAYAQVVANSYPGAYGFPFADRYKHLLADLGGKVDAMTITVLGDDTVVPAYVPQGNRNPQTGTTGYPQINVILVTPDTNFNQTTFKFDLQSYQGGNAYTFPTTLTGSAGTNESAQVNGVPTQEGLNIYTLELRGYTYSVLAQVTNGALVWASIAGGGNANLSGSNIFIGGLN